MNRRLLNAALKAMHAEQFEDLVYALVRAEHADARRLVPPDAGRDTIVAGTPNSGERVWQAKHHTSGISWTKCRESLMTATANRTPQDFTFVFPRDMTEGKEPGLEKLREEFPNLEILEPWGASTIAEKLNKEPGIRRAHIDETIGIDHEHAKQMLEHGAGLKADWDLQTKAATDGPLQALGLTEQADKAAAASNTQPALAAALFEQLAEATREKMPAISDVMLLRAAQSARAAGDRTRAGTIYLQVSGSALRRGDPVAEYAAFRASWELPEEQQHLADVALARALWPERGDEAVAALRATFDQALEAGDTGRILESADAYCEAAAAHDAWEGIRDVSQRAAAVLGPVQDAGPHLSLELDRLEAMALTGEDPDNDFEQLMLSPLGRNNDAAAVILARWGCAHASRGNAQQAISRFRDSAKHGRLSGDSDEEIAESIFSEDTVAQLLGDGNRLEQTARIAAADLRGRRRTAAVLADRCETDGLRAWLEDRGYDARRLLTMSWSIHRRAGHLGGTARAATTLQALFANTEEWSEALRWAVNSASHTNARSAAAHLDWERTHTQVEHARRPWELGPSFEALAATGSLATDEDIAQLTPMLLAAAAERSDEGNLRDKPDVAARRALATVLCRIPSDSFDAALQQVIYETESTPYPPVDTLHGLLLATDAGLCDATDLATRFFCIYDRSHLGGYGNVLEHIERSDAAKATVTELAEKGLEDRERPLTSLILAAWLDLPDESEALAKGAADIVARALRDELEPNEILRHGDRGRLARWASPANQQACAAQLVAILADRREIDVHRFEAAEALDSLAARIGADAASRILDLLFAAGEDIWEESLTDGGQSHPNGHFARVRMNTPTAGPAVRATGLRAVCSLAQRCGRQDDVRDIAHDALISEEPELRVTAIKLAARYPGLLTADFERLLNDQDSTVRAAAFVAADRQGATLQADDPRVLALCDPCMPLAVRSTVLRVARRSLQRHAAALQRLADDPHVFVRAAAHHPLS